MIHGNLQTALEATGVTSTDGEEANRAAGAALSAFLSAFESTKQRFFNHLLQGLKAPSVIDAIRLDIETGWAPVVQIVSTGEALLKRRLETLDPDEDLTEAIFTPKDYCLSYLEKAFPVHQQVMVEQEDGSVLSQPLRDENGQLVPSREAEALRDAMIEDLLLLAPVPSALEQIIWAFGPESVAEVTGRSQRPVKGSNGVLRIERRSASANTAETRAFMNGDKDLLIFSDAGGTGRSYHAARSAKNQARRRHYLLEPGWRADAAIQGLGRTHRAAQVSEPFFRVCTSNVHGEKRFTSTIARRLDTLGALTKGQRETASQGMFRASDNLESPIAGGVCAASMVILSAATALR
nr:strawberry notch C-terminal domain-containing protein [Ruegeria sp. ANG-R]